MPRCRNIYSCAAAKEGCDTRRNGIDALDGEGLAFLATGSNAPDVR